MLSWEHQGVMDTARWWSVRGRTVPKTCVAVDDRLTADQAVKLAARGTAMLWLGDFNNAKQILSAIDRRVSKSSKKARPVTVDAAEFYRIRQARTHRSRMLSLILVPVAFDAESGAAEVPLPRAPQLDCALRFGYADQPGFGTDRAVVSLRELSGVQSAYQWYLRGVEVPVLGAKIYPHYGTFMPTRQEYVDLVARAPLSGQDSAVDIGTGTGVLAALLVKRGVKKVIGTDIHQRAVDCANDNFTRLGISHVANARLTNMFPGERAQLIVCNPPWLPGRAASTLDAAVYDPDSQMLRQFLAGLPENLTDDGEGWLVLSDLAELLGLRTRQMLLDTIDEAGLKIIDRLDAAPSHKRATDKTDALHAARSREVTSLWRLQARRAESI